MARQVFAMRTAISPRFAIRSVRIGKQSLYWWGRRFRLPSVWLQTTNSEWIPASPAAII